MLKYITQYISIQNRQAKLFDGIDTCMTSCYNNDTNNLETKEAIALLEEAELQHLRNLEAKRHQIQVTELEINRKRIIICYITTFF